MLQLPLRPPLSLSGVCFCFGVCETTPLSFRVSIVCPPDEPTWVMESIPPCVSEDCSDAPKDGWYYTCSGGCQTVVLCIDQMLGDTSHALIPENTYTCPNGEHYDLGDSSPGIYRSCGHEFIEICTPCGG